MTEEHKNSTSENTSMQGDVLDGNDPFNLQRQPTPTVGDDTEYPVPPNVLQIEWTDDDLRGLADVAEDDARRIARATQAPLLQLQLGNGAGHRTANLEHRHSHKPSLRLGAINNELSQSNHSHGGVSVVLMLAAVVTMAFVTLKVVLHRRRRCQQYQPID